MVCIEALNRTRESISRAGPLAGVGMIVVGVALAILSTVLLTSFYKITAHSISVIAEAFWPYRGILPVFEAVVPSMYTLPVLAAAVLTGVLLTAGGVAQALTGNRKSGVQAHIFEKQA